MKNCIIIKLELNVLDELSNARNLEVEAIKKKNAEFASNRKALLPHVIKYLTYIVQIHNNYTTTGSGSQTPSQYVHDVRLMSRRGLYMYHGTDKLSLQDVILKYTSDEFFFDNGAVWCADEFTPRVVEDSTKIWLNSGKGAYVHNGRLEYSMTGIKTAYADSIEDYIKDIIALVVKDDNNIK